MRPNHEDLVLNNPALGACYSWYFSRAYADAAEGAAPTLPNFIIAAAMLSHRPTVEQVRGMQFDTGIGKAISERPDIIANLQQRMEYGAKRSIRSLQLGCSSGILLREGSEGFPAFRAIGTLLPVSIRDGEADVRRIYATAKRLGRWFADEGLLRLSAILLVEF